MIILQPHSGRKSNNGIDDLMNKGLRLRLQEPRIHVRFPNGIDDLMNKGLRPVSGPRAFCGRFVERNR